MFSRIKPLSSTRHHVTVAMAATLVLTLSEPTMVFAREPSSVGKQTLAASTPSSTTDFSARRRHRHYYRGNPAAGLAIMGAMIGTIGAIAASQHDDYYYGPGYYAGPGYYYGPPPVYYAPRPYYYGPRVYHYYGW
ncbi:conserved exported hypothetical protein [Bradyrhizobium sp. STM 3843]|uniref:hypothetical protein n=1 Tax=unclassified Bradyrhizobium TaxID=2631580 RepID=UPI000240348F|nr:hypothetical protein [Bradyrhizobium sp. STM 3843]CCE11339.1 conserved exported hypothetical protein [Bradyrhizobium sp. STM 3843]